MIVIFWRDFNQVFRQKHTPESAVVRVMNDILKDDSGECSMLVLPDASATFDTVDHGIIFDRLRTWVGISGATLQWFSPYFSNRKSVVSVDSFTSS